jgi:hypothetical protein
MPVVGATVLREGSDSETATDRMGEFLLTLPPGSTLRIAAAGYIPQTLNLREGQTLYRIRLRTEDVAPEEQLGYPTTLTLDELLQGRLAGVQVFRNDWAPGALAKVTVHGAPAPPLYVVDGIPWQEGIDALAPADIIAVEVVKDAAELALYGNEGYHGVLRITTRSGKAGATTISYDGALSAQQTARTLPSLSLPEYAAYVQARRPYVSAEILHPAVRSALASTLLPGYVSTALLNPAVLAEETDWQQDIFRPALMHSHQVSLRGGTERLRLSASSGWTDRQGTIVGSDFSRFHMRLRLDARVNRWLAAGASLAYASIGQTLIDDGLIAQAMRTPPYRHVDIPPSQRNDDNRTTGAFYADITPLKGLALRSEYGFEEDNERFGETSARHAAHWRWQNRASYAADKGRNHLSFLAGFDLMSLYGYRGKAAYGNLRYDYDKRYFLALTIRTDNPAFSEITEHTGAASFAWSIADEPFLRDNGWLSTLKLHAGLSTCGSAAGLDLGFLDDRFTLDVDVFDQIYPGWIPYEPVRQGIDLALRFVNIDRPDCRWTTALNATFCSGPTFGFYNTVTFHGIEASLDFVGAHSLEPADFIRLNNAALGYSFPHKLLKPLSLGALKIQASLQNPCVFSQHIGFDPETALYAYPPYRAATLALHLRF